MTISSRLKSLGINDDAMLLNTDPYTCQWFIQCGNRPEGTVRHPRLGDVPCCSRCATALQLPLRRFPQPTTAAAGKTSATKEPRRRPIADDDRWEPTRRGWQLPEGIDDPEDEA